MNRRLQLFGRRFVRQSILFLGTLMFGLPSALFGQTSTVPVAGTGTTLSIVSYTGAQVVDNGISLFTGSYDGFIVSISSGFVSGDVLSYTGTLPGGVSASYNAGAGVLTFTGTASEMQYAALLNTVEITSSASPGTNKAVTFTAGTSVPYSGHYYEYVSTAVDWATASTNAAASTLFGMQGYLATITSAGENTFIEQKLSADGWVGGSDDVTLVTAAGGSSPGEGNWYWVTGPDAGTAISTGNNSPVLTGPYMNWNPGEPNNSGSSENYMQVYSVQAGQWNDLDGTGSLGYVVEYGGSTGDPSVDLTYTRSISYICPTITSSNTQANVSCFGAANGSATVSPSGGTTPYSYNWAPSGGTGATASGLAPNTYTVTITDADLCSTTESFTITQPTAFSVTPSFTNVACNGASTGSATVVVSGATPTYTYSWAPSGGNAATATGLAANNYTVTITDANACTTTQSFAITQPTALVLTGSQTNETPCYTSNNGTATVSASGGTGSYTYSWAPSGGSAATATNLNAGNYTVTVTDANSCTATQSYTITEPTQIVGAPTQTNVSCNGGSNGTATVVASGGGSPFYSYSWAPYGGTGTTASGLVAGTYTVTISNGLGCSGTQTFTITEPTAITTTGSQTAVLCNGGTSGTATVTASGGAGFYSYAWSPTGGTGSTASGLAAGTYTVLVTDFNFCSTTRTYNITEPSALTTTGSSTNVSCFGGSNGTATVIPAGGTPGYTYSWAPTGGTAATATGLAANTYTVTVTDANNCTTTRTFNITAPSSALVATAGAQTNVSCNGGTTGSATVSVSGGSPGYTYSWAPSGGTSATASGLAAGTYTVTVTDASTCTATQTFNITQPTALVASAASQTNVSCNGGTNGAATVSVTGGTTSYTYSWAPSGGTASSATGLAAGVYTVTVTDANSCTATQTFNITEPAVLAATPVSLTNVSCNGGSNGAATVGVTGGTTGYTYSWAPSGGTAATATGLSAAVYTVTVTDANSCTATQTFNITQPTALVASAASQTNVSCNGGSNGSATVSVTGGTTSYTYSWAPSGGTAATASGLAAGVYTVTVTDANACTATQTFSITQPAALVATAASQTNVSCNGGSNGSATVSVTGGTTAYSYSWAPTGGTAATATGLTAAVYTVTVTDANSCTTTQTFNITQPTLLVATAASQTNVSCNGGSNGAATVSVTGGTTAYSYSWAPSGGNAATATGLAANNYTVTVTDANACTTTQTFSITQPTLITSVGTQTNLTCNGGSDGTAGVTVSGGTPGYTYSWAPSGGTAATATGLAAGNYTVTVTDANSCVHTRTFTLTQPTAITATTSQTNVSCNAGANGTATVVASGGSSPFYAYSWSPSGGTGTTATGLAAGNYTCTITNNLGCTGTATFTITQPTALTTTGSQTNLACNGGTTGSATVSVSGGTPGYTYAWAPTGGVNATASGLAAGNYTVTATDANGCTITRTYTLTQPSAIATTGSNTNVSCFGGSNGTATVSASGGTPGYTYSWAPTGGTAATATGLVAGTYTVTVTDANACTATRTYTITQPALLTTTGSSTNVSCFNGANGTATVVATGGTTAYTYSWAPSGGTAATATGLAAGTYTVTVTDANSCTTTRSFSITQPSAITTVGTQTNVSCNGGTNGSATVTATGGTGAYTYSWAPSGGTAATATNRPAGTYTVTVTDANGCTATRTYTITQPAVLATTGSQVNVSCNGLNNGTATVSASGGTTPYAYSWAPTGGTAATATNLSPGTYTVTVTDFNACTATRTYTITQPATLTATGTNTNVLCFGASTGTATVVPAGGTTPYTYSWAPTGGTAATTTNRPAGTYTVTVTDANLCTTTVSYTITQPTQLTTTGSQTNVLCNSGSTGTATVVASGGTPGYTYNWTPMGGTAATATNLPSNVYTVTVTDANACTATRTYNITQPAYLSTTGTQTNVSCNGNGDATATVTATGGTTPYTYSWAPTGGTAATASSLTPGIYTVTVTDANLCVATRTFNITQPAVLAATGTQVNILCNGATTGSATVTPTGGTTPYTYSWAPTGGTAATASGLAAGSYTVTVTDANLCATTQTYTLTEPTMLASTVSQTNVSCNAGTNGSATINVSGGVGPYTYNWMPTGGTAATESGLAAGTYTVTATDANGCNLSATYTITEPTVLIAAAAANSPVCTGDSLHLQGSVAGGTIPYAVAWTGPNGYSSIVNNPSISNVTLNEAGSYTVTFTDGNGCTAADIVSVVVNETPAVTTQPVATTACVGASAGFSVTATGTSINYQWRANGVNLTNTGVYSGAFTNTLTISDVTGLDGTMYDVIVYGVCTPDTSIAVQLSAPSFNQWTGTADTAWSNALNWQCGLVPTINTDVIIPGSAPKMPLVDIPGAVANSVTINNGASLGFVGAGSQLEIDEDITNLGSFNASNGAVKLSGPNAQSIPGGTYREIEITGGNIKTTQGNATVTTDLILTSGYLQLGNNNLTLSQNVTITGGSAASFVITDGTGKVIAQGLGAAGNAGLFIFPIGTIAGVYTPAGVQNAGTVDNFNARVINGVYSGYSNDVPLGFPMGANTVDRTWFINEAVAGGSNATVQLSWPLGVQLPGFNTSLCDVSHFNTTLNTWESGPVSQASGSIVLFSQTRTGQTTFSPFAMGTASAPLNTTAVVLSGTYNISDKSVDLSWDRSNDADVVTYNVERSVNGVDYKHIGSRETGEDRYELTDAEAGRLGVNQVYYRLQVLANDGSYVYTNTIKVDIAGSSVSSGLTLYPNPVTGSQVYISIADNAMASDMDIAIVDMLGKEVSTQHYAAGTYNPNAIVVNVGDIAHGMYTVRVKQSGVMMQTVKFTKK